MFARITTRAFELLVVAAVVLIALVFVAVKEGGIVGPAAGLPDPEQVLNERQITESIITQSQEFPALDAVKFKDYWGHPLLIEQTGELRLTRSIGPDGKPDTTDDIKMASDSR